MLLASALNDCNTLRIYRARREAAYNMGKYEAPLSSKLFNRTETNATHLVPQIIPSADSPKSRISQLYFYINIHNFYAIESVRYPVLINLDKVCRVR